MMIIVIIMRMIIIIIIIILMIINYHYILFWWLLLSYTLHIPLLLVALSKKCIFSLPTSSLRSWVWKRFKVQKTTRAHAIPFARSMCSHADVTLPRLDVSINRRRPGGLDSADLLGGDPKRRYLHGHHTGTVISRTMLNKINASWVQWKLEN